MTGSRCPRCPPASYAAPVASFSYLCHFSAALLVYSGIPSLTSYSHSSPPLRVAFWWTQSETVFLSPAIWDRSWKPDPWWLPSVYAEKWAGQIEKPVGWCLSPVQPLGLTSVMTGHSHRWDTKYQICYHVQEQVLLLGGVVRPS